MLVKRPKKLLVVKKLLAKAQQYVPIKANGKIETIVCCNILIKVNCLYLTSRSTILFSFIFPPFSFPYKYTFLGEIEHEKRRLKI